MEAALEVQLENDFVGTALASCRNPCCCLIIFPPEKRIAWLVQGTGHSAIVLSHWLWGKNAWFEFRLCSLVAELCLFLHL